MFYGLNGPPEIDAVLMFFQLWRRRGVKKKKRKVEEENLEVGEDVSG